MSRAFQENALDPKFARYFVTGDDLKGFLVDKYPEANVEDFAIRVS